jgi:hypothetical protein
MTPSSRAKGRNRSAPRKKLVEMTNSCICCTLRDDLLSEVRRLAGEGRFDYLLIKSTGIAEPLHIIGEEAQAREADPIIMGAHRRRFLRDVFIGTTIERVTRTAGRPVLMANAATAAPWRRSSSQPTFPPPLGRPRARRMRWGFSTGLR